MSKHLPLIPVALLLYLTFACNRVMEPPVTAPFTGLDTICTNDWWNRAPNPIHNVKVERDRVVAFGLYTVSKGTLKLSAQLYPLYRDETREVRLEVERDGRWQEIATEKVNDLGCHRPDGPAAGFLSRQWPGKPAAEISSLSHRLRHPGSASSISR